MSIGHFENDKDKINAFYRHGREVMKKRLPELLAFMENV